VITAENMSEMLPLDETKKMLVYGIRQGCLAVQGALPEQECTRGSGHD
jgi:hypothetical protein